MTISYADKIPNNVDLGSDKVLQRALEHWQPEFLKWWMEMGPEGSHTHRCVPANRGQRSSERLGAFRLREDARIPLGDFPLAGRWRTQRSISATTRASLPGRTFPVSTAPTCGGSSSPKATRNPPRSSSSVISDSPVLRCTTCAICFRSTSRRAATCGPWCTCCIVISGATAAKRPRPCCSAVRGISDNPRILGAFNEKTPDWLAFFMFTYFTDRDGKFQLLALAESGFDPLARTTRFMLMEEAHHMYVGESGVGRVIHRTCEVMAAAQDRRSSQPPCARRHRSCRPSSATSIFISA